MLDAEFESIKVLFLRTSDKDEKGNGNQIRMYTCFVIQTSRILLAYSCMSLALQKLGVVGFVTPAKRNAPAKRNQLYYLEGKSDSMDMSYIYH